MITDAQVKRAENMIAYEVSVQDMYAAFLSEGCTDYEAFLLYQAGKLLWETSDKDYGEPKN